MLIVRFRNRREEPVAETIPVEQQIETFVDPRENFSIVFEQDKTDDLYAALEDPNDSEPTVISALLEDPVRKISLNAKRSAGSFMLYGAVELETEERAAEVFKSVEKSVRYLHEPEAITQRSGALIIDGDTKLLIGRSPGYTERKSIIISTGVIRESYREYSEAFPLPESSPENFRKNMNNIIGGIALTLATAYKEANIKAPNETIQFRLPSQRQRFYEDEESKQIKSGPEDISKMFGVEFPRISFNEIGGQAKAKEEIRSLSTAINNAELYQKWGTRPPKGVLLYGPPGTGKTLLAKALASESEAAFYAITPSDITAKWYGESEQRVKNIFEVAAKQERAIIYFDEIDAIIPDRENSAHEATKRVVSTILQHLDGVRSCDNIMIVASTNRKDAIDPAMLRPGRLDALVEVELPNAADRKEIFNIHKKQAETIAKRSLFTAEVSSTEIAEMTARYSGADIAEIIRRTLEMKVRSETLLEMEPGLVDMRDLQDQIEQYERNKTQES